MKKFQLSEEQKKIVENHLFIVRGAIHRNIIVNDSIFGLSYDDLFQEGCLWLCKAVFTFDESKDVKFETYAYSVVSNGLRTYCRLTCGKQKHYISVPIHTEEENGFSFDQIADEDRLEDYVSEMDTFVLLGKMKQQYQGTVKLGIEAIEWKVKGFTGREIADMYGVNPNLVGAWISRASSKLKENEEILSFFGKSVEKQPLQVVNKK